MKLRTFANSDARILLTLWQAKREENPNFFTSMTSERLENQILGNILFDPQGLIIAFDDDQPLGFIHVSFAPNGRGTDIDPRIGILFSPIVPAQTPDRQRVIEELIRAGERYFQARGTQRWFAGGYANASPFYTGLYGPCNPDGILESDQPVIDALKSSGYSLFSSSCLFQVMLNQYEMGIDQKIHETRRHYSTQRMSRWTPPNWWEANVYRSFFSYEWNVFDRKRMQQPIAGAVLHQMLPIQSRNAPNPNASNDLVLAYIGVDEKLLRQGIATFLFTEMTADIIGGAIYPVVIYNVVPKMDQRLIAFLQKQGFQQKETVLSFCKENAF